MKLEQSIKFIKGSFTPGEAKDLLFDLMANKIKFHSIKDFSSNERFGKPEKGSQKRIDELKSDRNKFIKLIETAIEQNIDLIIESDIKIALKK
ncbi:MAG: hypothetical protein ABI288_08265 [Ginsengibacter sp.]